MPSIFITAGFPAIPDRASQGGCPPLMNSLGIVTIAVLARRRHCPGLAKPAGVCKQLLAKWLKAIPMAQSGGHKPKNPK